MNKDLAELWARLSEDEQSACRTILANKFTWPVLQCDVVRAVGEVGSATTVRLVEALIKKGVLTQRGSTRWLAPVVDFAALVPKQKPPADDWTLPAARRVTRPPVSKPEVPEIEPDPAPTPWLDPERVILVVSEESQLPVAALKGDSILPDAAKWRGIAMYLIRIHCHDGEERLFTHARIGEMFGRTAAAVSTIYFEVRYLLASEETWYCVRVARLEQRLGLSASSQSPALESTSVAGEP